MWILSASLNVWANRTCARKGQTEDDPIACVPANCGCAVQACPELHQRGSRQRAVTRFPGKVVQRGQVAVGRDFEDRAQEVGPALEGCAVEVPVTGLQQSGVRVLAVARR